MSTPFANSSPIDLPPDFDVSAAITTLSDHSTSDAGRLGVYDNLMLAIQREDCEKFVVDIKKALVQVLRFLLADMESVDRSMQLRAAQVVMYFSHHPTIGREFSEGQVSEVVRVIRQGVLASQNVGVVAVFLGVLSMQEFTHGRMNKHAGEILQSLVRLIAPTKFGTEPGVCKEVCEVVRRLIGQAPAAMRDNLNWAQACYKFLYSGNADLRNAAHKAFKQGLTLLEFNPAAKKYIADFIVKDMANGGEPEKEMRRLAQDRLKDRKALEHSSEADTTDRTVVASMIGYVFWMLGELFPRDNCFPLKNESQVGTLVIRLLSLSIKLFQDPKEQVRLAMARSWALYAHAVGHAAKADGQREQSDGMVSKMTVEGRKLAIKSFMKPCTKTLSDKSSISEVKVALCNAWRVLVAMLGDLAFGDELRDAVIDKMLNACANSQETDASEMVESVLLIRLTEQPVHNGDSGEQPASLLRAALHEGQGNWSQLLQASKGHSNQALVWFRGVEWATVDGGRWLPMSRRLEIAIANQASHAAGVHLSAPRSVTVSSPQLLEAPDANTAAVSPSAAVNEVAPKQAAATAQQTERAISVVKHAQDDGLLEVSAGSEETIVPETLVPGSEEQALAAAVLESRPGMCDDRASGSSTDQRETQVQESLSQLMAQEEQFPAAVAGLKSPATAALLAEAETQSPSLAMNGESLAARMDAAADSPTMQLDQDLPAAVEKIEGQKGASSPSVLKQTASAAPQQDSASKRRRVAFDDELPHNKVVAQLQQLLDGSYFDGRSPEELTASMVKVAELQGKIALKLQQHPQFRK